MRYDRCQTLEIENAKLHEQIAALESREVCTTQHENVEECGYCQRDRLQAECEKLQMDDWNGEMEASTRLLVADTTSSSIATFYARFLVSRLDESRTLSEKLRAAMEAWKKVFPQHGLVAPQFLEAAERLTEEASEGKG